MDTYLLSILGIILGCLVGGILALLGGLFFIMVRYIKSVLPKRRKKSKSSLSKHS